MHLSRLGVLCVLPLALSAFQPPTTAVPGQIYDPMVDPNLVGASPLDPNGDGWITSTGVPFSASISEDSEEFESDDWSVIWHYEAEPIGDTDTGGTCSATDIVDNPNTGEHAAFYRIIDPDLDPTNRNEQLVFRVRLAQQASGAFGFSILIDSDAGFGASDANPVSGNPGFEMEVLYGSGGGSAGVTIQDVDGKTSGFTELAFYDAGTHDQKSYAKFTNCTGDDPIFIDFYVEMDDFPVGITSATPLRFVFATSSSPSTALGGSASDIGGVDDSDPVLSDDDAAFTTVIENTPSVSFATGYAPAVCDDVNSDGICDDLLVAQWTFDGGSLSDAQGNFADLTLNGGASVSNDRLVLGSIGDWANTTTYTGPGIVEKTLVAWVALEDISSTAGSALTLDKVGTDEFDGIVYGENASFPTQYMSGSSNWNRTEPFSPGYQETGCEMVQIAITYADNGSGLTTVSGYRNGALLGTYTKGSLANWIAGGDAEAVFGARHTSGSAPIQANFIGQIEEARIYGGALTVEELEVIDAQVTSSFASTIWYLDADGDGLGVLLSDSTSCTQPVGYVADSTDNCDDNTACNYDGSGGSNAACTYASSWYLDADSDGLGVLLSDSTNCTQPVGYVADSTDNCDDNTACNYDGSGGSNAACTYASSWYLDADGDGLGVLLSDSTNCTQPVGYVADSTDNCDDNTACNYDGSGGSNAACSYASSWYLDADGDGLGVLLSDSTSCTQPVGYVADSTDNCDDNTACNYDGSGGSNAACTYASSWYLDADGDGLGVLLSDSTHCTQPVGYVADSTDNCDDNTATNYEDAGNPNCNYGAASLNDSLVYCNGADNVTIDLDTLHAHTGVTGYSLTSGTTGSYASASISGNILTLDFSGEGVGVDTLSISASTSGASHELAVYLEEADYPVRTSKLKALAASFPGADDGALQVTLTGSYDQPVTMHIIGQDDQQIVNGITQLPNAVHMIQGYTNVKGCMNLEPATTPLPPVDPAPARLLVPCVPCQD